MPHRLPTGGAAGILVLAAFVAVAAAQEPSQSAEQETAMSQEQHDRRIDYVEFATSDLEAAKAFYGGVFGWSFTDWGPDYSSFADGRLNGGFRLEEPDVSGGPLVILYAVDLEAMAAAVEAHGGKIVREIFGFPGGRRFHFTDPDGYELAVWSDTGVEPAEPESQG